MINRRLFALRLGITTLAFAADGKTKEAFAQLLAALPRTAAG